MGILLMVAAGLMTDDIFAQMQNHPFSRYRSYSWSSSTVMPQGMHPCVDKDGKVIYTNQQCLSGESAVIDPQATKNLPELPEHSRFRCDGRTHCSQMTSCEEATFFIRHCPDTEMDSDHDGVPCESQWCQK
jgi:hypothetical protein